MSKCTLQLVTDHARGALGATCSHHERLSGPLGAKEKAGLCSPAFSVITCPAWLGGGLRLLLGGQRGGQLGDRIVTRDLLHSRELPSHTIQGALIELAL